MMLKVLLILAVVAAGLFLLSLVIYFFNLDMKLAAAMIPIMNKIYDKGAVKREKKAAKKAETQGKKENDKSVINKEKAGRTDGTV